jgi:hypothetical protein
MTTKTKRSRPGGLSRCEGSTSRSWTVPLLILAMTLSARPSAGAVIKVGSGFKSDATITTDSGPTVHRNRFYFKNMDWVMPASQAPRSIRVLESARDVPERELIESVYGQDMSDCKVIATEIKLPINEATYKDSPKELKDITPWRSGQTFWLGFLINDNDQPGTDVQNFLVWPATYGNFNPTEDGAGGVLE